MASAPSSLTWSQARHVDTVIFVDVDGVLNIGAADSGEAPLLLNKTNIDISMKAWGHHHNHAQRDCIEKMVYLAQKDLGHGEDSTYAKFACVGSSSVSEELARRLADIIRTGGDRNRVAVVMSSNWRKTQHAARVRKLEESVARHLGSSFEFDAKTPNRSEQVASDRLESIGDFLSELSKQRAGVSHTLKALILEDFFITGMDGWTCGGVRMNSVADAEAYLERRAPSAKAKLVHCYDKWVTDSGLEVRVGSGLTRERVEDATAFLLDRAEEEQKVEVVKQELSVGKRRSIMERTKLLAKLPGSGKRQAATPPPAGEAG
eukprot:CAMPEP_0195151202 /NCGR_PEP_ID=MMETSP0448-20130528/180156_1 /TAXON_ID=66468 /ORGANISM="Heterocapsa triquestra, Strain CCMP 448" /LENGTH=318 /DNA_ID=CAMNT_0040189917 /DNA_START=53 /DNA_END=1005 /DNA_ORIENTATION=-